MMECCARKMRRFGAKEARHARALLLDKFLQRTSLKIDLFVLAILGQSSEFFLKKVSLKELERRSLKEQIFKATNL